jgi:predicted dehydrogenase
MRRISRRRFLSSSTKCAVGISAGVATLAGVKPKRAVGAHDKVNIALIGCGSRGTEELIIKFSNMPDVNIAYLCDLNDDRSAWAIDELKKAGYKAINSIKIVKEYQRVLDDKNVDAVVNATPDHWHGPLTIYACQAGKDVYVEKPPSHNIWEGRKMVEAARKYKRIVQSGTQNRSGAYNLSAEEYIRSGKLGTIHLCKVYNHLFSRAFALGPNSTAPAGFDWNTWLGPTPIRPYNQDIYQDHWHAFWTYSGGLLADDGVHQLDLARRLVGKDYPEAVYCSGGIFGAKGAKNDNEVPDTQVINYDFDDLIMTYEQTPNRYMKKTPWPTRYNRKIFPNWQMNSTRIEIYGTEGLMIVGRHGGGWQVFTEDGEVVAQEYGYLPDVEHQTNFIDCIRSRKLPNGDIEEGHRSAVLVHLGNISLRLDSRKLVFDARTEKIVGDDEAGKLVKRTYREPFAIPENV